MVFAGDLTFNPEKDFLEAPDGTKFKLEPPRGEELPQKGFDPGENTYQPPAKDGSSVKVQVNPKSDRLQLLEPFAAWDGKDLVIISNGNGNLTADQHAHSHQSQRQVHH